MPQSHRFGRVEVRPAERALLIDGKPAELGSRAFDVLQALIIHRDRVVTKDELLDMVWPGLVVEENNLQAQVSNLRKLLGPQAITTIPGRGYQFSLAETVLPEVTIDPVSSDAASTLTDAERAAVFGGPANVVAADAAVTEDVRPGTGRLARLPGALQRQKVPVAAIAVAVIALLGVAAFWTHRPDRESGCQLFPCQCGGSQYARPLDRGATVCQSHRGRQPSLRRRWADREFDR